MNATPLESLYIFEGLSQEEIAYFLLMTQTQTYWAGEKVVSQGDASNNCAYYIENGHVRILRDGQEIAVTGPGGFFGEIALITSEPRTATVEAVGDVELRIFQKEDFLALFKRSEHHGEMQEEIRRRIMDRVRHV